MTGRESCPMVDLRMPTPSALSGSRQDGNHPAFVFSAMIPIDACALSLWLADWITVMQLAALHLLGVAVVLSASCLLNRRARLSALLEASFCGLAGPLGALVLQFVRLGQALPSADTDILEEQDDDAPKPVSIPDAIHEMHLQGRRSRPAQAEDQSYAEIIRHGDLPRHNEIIAAISRNYEPEMYPALSLALGSSSPALKVQAAAVFSKLRRTLGDAANDLLAIQPATLTPDTAHEYYKRLLTVARSGFVDAGKAKALMARARVIEDLGVLADEDAPLPEAGARDARHLQRDLRVQGPRLKRYSCGGLG